MTVHCRGTTSAVQGAATLLVGVMLFAAAAGVAKATTSGDPTYNYAHVMLGKLRSQTSAPDRENAAHELARYFGWRRSFDDFTEVIRAMSGYWLWVSQAPMVERPRGMLKR